MSESKNEESFRFVLRHYRRRLFDPDSAIGNLRKAVGIDRAWRMRRAVLGLSAAAAVAAVVFAGLALHRSRMNVWEETTASAVVLPDHSTVTLKEGASLAFQPRRFAKDRTVRLSGTGFFEVERNPSVPFEVLSGEARVRVLGTKFQFDANRSEVYVREGRVLFAKEDSDKGLEMTAGTHAVLMDGSDMPVFIRTSVNPDVWATGRLVYNAAPLGDVLAELSSIFGTELSVARRNAGNTSLTGEFLVSDGLAHIVSAIETAMGVDIISSEDNLK